MGNSKTVVVTDSLFDQLSDLRAEIAKSLEKRELLGTDLDYFVQNLKDLADPLVSAQSLAERSVEMLTDTRQLFNRIEGLLGHIHRESADGIPDPTISEIRAALFAYRNFLRVLDPEQTDTIDEEHLIALSFFNIHCPPRQLTEEERAARTPTDALGDALCYIRNLSTHPDTPDDIKKTAEQILETCYNKIPSADPNIQFAPFDAPPPVYPEEEQLEPAFEIKDSGVVEGTTMHRLIEEKESDRGSFSGLVVIEETSTPGSLVATPVADTTASSTEEPDYDTRI